MPHVVVVGAGYAGVLAALRAARVGRGRVDVTLSVAASGLPIAADGQVAGDSTMGEIAQKLPEMPMAAGVAVPGRDGIIRVMELDGRPRAAEVAA
jgi:glycine/D-amino acid oxidase-like deaminating enzyme